MSANGLSFHHPSAFVLGCIAITAGVLAHIPMFVHSASMGYHMAGMPMGTTMMVGMGLIPLGLLMAAYGLMPRLAEMRLGDHGSSIHFHVADGAPLNAEHWKLVVVLTLAVTIDVMKPATIGFVMPGITKEYGITESYAGMLALTSMIGTVVGSILWGRLADIMGRRSSIVLSALMFMGTAICGAMTSFEGNLVMCFFMGMSAGGLLPITFTLMAEMIPAAHRGWLLVAVGGVGTCAGYLLVSGAAAVLAPLFSWRALWLLGLPTGLLLILLNHYIPESPRFLANAGLKRQARAVLAKFGGETLDGEELGDEAATHGSSDSADEELHVSRYGFRELVSGPYSKITIGLMGSGISWGLVNFGFLLWLPTNLRNMGMSSEAANELLAQSGLLALPGILVVVWLYHHWSSIKTLVLFNVATAAALLLFFIFGVIGIHATGAIIVATALLLISASGIIAMLIPYAAEIYPVHLRGTGAGLVAATSKFGGILGAVCGIAGVFDYMTVSAIIIAIPLVVFALLLLKSGIDTRGRRLEDIHTAVLGKANA